MENTGGGGRYTSNPYRMNLNSGSLEHSKVQHGSTSYPNHGSNRGYDDDDDDDEEMVEVEVERDYDDDDDDNDNEVEHGTRQMNNRVENLDEETDDESEDDEYEQSPNGANMRENEDEFERYQKKRKLKSMFSGYEDYPSTSNQGPNIHDWTENETLFLLQTWGDKFIKNGRKSLRAEEWQDVAEEVSQEMRIERTEDQCRTRLDTLRKKYKKEKLKSEERGGSSSKWVYFKRMDFLMSGSQQRQVLSCGMDSGEYVFMNPKAYLDLANGMDELRDSPCNSESEGEDDYEKDGASFQLLADSINKFGSIYEKVEQSKRQQLVELEKERMNVQNELEVQKRQILERAEAEIAKIRGGGDDDNDLSAENTSE